MQTKCAGFASEILDLTQGLLQVWPHTRHLFSLSLGFSDWKIGIIMCTAKLTE